MDETYIFWLNKKFSEIKGDKSRISIVHPKILGHINSLNSRLPGWRVHAGCSIY